MALQVDRGNAPQCMWLSLSGLLLYNSGPYKLETKALQFSQSTPGYHYSNRMRIPASPGPRGGVCRFRDQLLVKTYGLNTRKPPNSGDLNSSYKPRKAVIQSLFFFWLGEMIPPKGKLRPQSWGTGLLCFLLDFLSWKSFNFRGKEKALFLFGTGHLSCLCNSGGEDFSPNGGSTRKETSMPNISECSVDVGRGTTEWVCLWRWGMVAHSMFCVLYCRTCFQPYPVLSEITWVIIGVRPRDKVSGETQDGTAG